ncbi:MerC domain-containing protein [Pontiellaceae bacterium B12227]|nr:MerC domain-containing protein [Pontiellaceae bacterium B12227]
MKATLLQSNTSGILDRLAIGMAVVCGIHCLMMPIIIALLPIVTASFFAHEHFHLWMLLFVLPTTGFSIFMGCREHKDKWTATLSLTGLGIMIAVTAIEYATHSSCATCAGCSRSSTAPVPPSAWFNTIGGLFLASAHVRNFKLCRNSSCHH